MALGTKMDAQSSGSIPAIKKKMNPQGEVTDPETNDFLRALMKHLLDVIGQEKSL